MPDSFASLAARIEADLRRVREDVHVFGGSLVLPGSRLAGTFEALSNLDAALAEMKERAERLEAVAEAARLVASAWHFDDDTRRGRVTDEEIAEQQGTQYGSHLALNRALAALSSTETE